MESIATSIPSGLPLKARVARTARRGLTLIEAAMVLAILALVVAGIMLFYTQANSSRLTTQALGDLAAIQQSVRSLYGGQASYDGINNSALVSTRALPSRMVVQGSTNGLRHSFNGPITVSPGDAGAGTGSGFSVAFANVPSDACSRMLSSDLGRGLYSAGTSGNMRSQSDGLPFTPEQAATACSASNNTITWTFN